jgi:cytochrome c peroxidase
MRLFLSILLLLPMLANASEQWRLSDVCPAGFRPEQGRCFLQSLYGDYASLQDSGVGGLKTGLPPLREGFTPQQIDLGR